MEDKPEQSPLDKLESRLERVREARKKEERPGRPVSGKAVGLAFRILTELIVGVLVGATLGWFLDNWLGTTPWLMILFFALGFVTSLRNIYSAWRHKSQ